MMEILLLFQKNFQERNYSINVRKLFWMNILLLMYVTIMIMMKKKPKTVIRLQPKVCLEFVSKKECSNNNNNNNTIIIIIPEYGYGFLAVFIISVLSLGGLLAFPCMYRVSFQYVLVTCTALAVGTLFGDALLHLIPFVCIFIF